MIEASGNNSPRIQFKGIYFKIGAILLLIFVLQIPIACINGLIRERIQTKEEAERSVTQVAGPNQTVVAPVLSIPYNYRYVDEKQHEKWYRTYAQILPDNLHIVANVEVEKRHRGIFEFPVYISKIRMEGTIFPEKLASRDIDAKDISWNEAFVNIGITDPRTIRDAGKLTWNSQQVDAEPGAPGVVFGNSGIHFPITSLTAASSGAHTFQIDLTFGGSQSLNFLPVGRTTDVSLTSSWPDPNFIGSYSPVERRVTSKGFEAHWKILDLGRNFPRVLSGNNRNDANAQTLSSSQFGVGLYSPVDTHRMSDRALKYEIFVIGLTFMIFALFEIFSAVRVHSIQYLLVGAALVLFYLLLLSLSEHIGFSGAYAIASILVLGLVGGYSRSVLRARGSATTVGLSLGLLYGFFYTLLQEQDYSLLIGTLGLTAILGFVMYLTRNLDWYGLTPEQADGQTASCRVP